MARARLLFATLDGPQSFELDPMTTVGRDPRSSIPLRDKLSAPSHCVLERRGALLILRDLATLNGTYVNGVRVNGEQTLKHGDEIALGATRARYDDGSGLMNFPMPAISQGAVQPQPTFPGGCGEDGGGGQQPPPVAPAMVEHPGAGPAGRR